MASDIGACDGVVVAQKGAHGTFVFLDLRFHVCSWLRLKLSSGEHRTLSRGDAAVLLLVAGHSRF